MVVAAVSPEGPRRRTTGATRGTVTQGMARIAQGNRRAD